MQCESQAPPGLLEGDGLARPAADLEELGVLIGKLRSDQDGDVVEGVGQLPVQACDKACDLSRFIGVELSPATVPGDLFGLNPL